MKTKLAADRGKTKYYRVSIELDGDKWFWICSELDLKNSIFSWIKEYGEGVITIKGIYMTDKEFDSMPEFEGI